MTIKLPSELDFLLRDVAFKAQIDINSIRMPGGSWQLDPGMRSTLIDAVSNEFASTGLLANDEPNARGLLLEEVLDRLNRQRFVSE